MKSAIGFLAIILVSGSSFASNSGVVEVDGKAVQPLTLKSGEATTVSTNASLNVVVACGEFSGVVEGLGPVRYLEVGECTSAGSLSSLVECVEK